MPAFVRGPTVLSRLLKKGEEHAAQAGIAPETLRGARPAEDMLRNQGVSIGKLDYLGAFEAQ